MGNYFYYKISRFKIILTVVGKGQKSHRNYIEDPIGETYNFIIRKFNKNRNYNIISLLYKSNMA